MTIAEIIKRRIELKKMHICLLEAEVESLEEILENEVKPEDGEKPDTMIDGRPYWYIGGFREG